MTLKCVLSSDTGDLHDLVLVDLYAGSRTIQNELQAYFMLYFNSQATRSAGFLCFRFKSVFNNQIKF